MKYDLSIKFQRKLLAALLTDPAVAFTYRHVVQASYFESEELTMICGALFSYMDEFGALPKPKYLADKLRREIKKFVGDENVEERTIDVLKKLYKTEVDLSDANYLVKLAAKFVESQEWKNVFIEAPDFIDAQDFNTLFDKCLMAREKGRIVMPYVVTKELEGRFERLEKVVEGGLIKTGIKHFDKHFKVYPPFIGLIIGDSGKGKTWMLLHLARAALKQGYNVLYFTGEMPADDLSIRFDASLIGVNTDYFYEESVHDKFKKKIREAYKRYPGNLTIVPFASGMYSVSELDADIRRFCLKKNDAPKVVLVDFVDLLTYKDSARRGMSGWEEQIAISQRLQGITYAHNIVMWAAGTRKTKRYNTEKNALSTREDKSGAGDIVYATDAYLTLNQSAQDLRLNRVLINVDKFRKGKSEYIIGVTTDFNRSRFCVKSLGAMSKADFDDRRKNKT